MYEIKKMTNCSWYMYIDFDVLKKFKGILQKLCVKKLKVRFISFHVQKFVYQPQIIAILIFHYFYMTWYGTLESKLFI